MSNGKKPSVRPVSRSLKKAKRIEDCRCAGEVERRLRLGWSSQRLAEYIQSEAGELTDLSLQYVRKLIDEYRKTIPSAELALTSENHFSRQRSNERTAYGIDEVGELEKLYKLQLKRIDIDFKNEVNLNKLLPTTGREIFYAMKLLKQSSDLKMDLGLVKRQLGEVSVTGASAVQIGNRYNEGVGQVLSDPDSRRKVLGFVDTLMMVASRANIDAGDIIKSTVEVSGEKVIDTDCRESSSIDPEVSSDNEE